MAAQAARRPIGITLLALLVLVVGLLYIVVALQYLGVIDPTSGKLDYFSRDWIGAIVYLFVAAFAFWVAFGLWRLDSGAWIMTILLALLGLTAAVSSIIAHTSTGNLLGPIVLSTLLLVYCVSAPVRRAFKT